MVDFHQVNPQIEKIRKNAMIRVCNLLYNYYTSINKQVNQSDLKNETVGIVKKMDQTAKENAHNESDYNACMSNLCNKFEHELIEKQKEVPDPVMMATVMINFLPKLQDFMDHADLQPHDVDYIQRLIQFIKSIPSDNFGVHINYADQIEAVKIYYEKLFIPLKKTIENQQITNQGQNISNQQQQQQQMQQLIQQQQQQQQMQRPQISQSMSQQMPSPIQGMNSIPRQMPAPTPKNSMSNALQPQPSQGQKQPRSSVPLQQQQQIQQQQSLQQIQRIQNPRSPQQRARNRQVAAVSPQMMQQAQQQQQPQMNGMSMQVDPMQSPQPILPQAQPPQHQMQERQPNPREKSELIKQLFQSVRNDCAVFYSTPHPPHF